MANNMIIVTAFLLRVGSLPKSLGNLDVPEIPRWLLFHPVPTLKPNSAFATSPKSNTTMYS